MLNVGQHIDLMSHGLGKTPDSRHSLYATFNRAGRALFTRHSWTWRQQGPISLPAVADQDYIELPLNFGGELESWIPNTSGHLFLEKCSLGYLARLRATQTTNVVTGRFCIYYPGWAGQGGAEDEPTRRALLYPTPTTNADPTIQLIYRRRWVEVSTDDTKRVPDIPSEFEHALILLARSFAVCVENQRAPYEDGPYQAEIARLIAEDATAQANLGRMTGGVDRRFSRSSGPGRYPQSATVS